MENAITLDQPTPMGQHYLQSRSQCPLQCKASREIDQVVKSKAIRALTDITNTANNNNTTYVDTWRRTISTDPSPHSNPVIIKNSRLLSVRDKHREAENRGKFALINPGTLELWRTYVNPCRNKKPLGLTNFPPRKPSEESSEIHINDEMREYYSTPGVAFPPFFSPLGCLLRSDAKFMQMKEWKGVMLATKRRQKVEVRKATEKLRSNT